MDQAILCELLEKIIREFEYQHPQDNEIEGMEELLKKLEEGKE